MSRIEFFTDRNCIVQWHRYLAQTLFLVIVTTTMPVAGHAQLLRKNEYGVGVTVAIYQFDETRSKQFSQVNTLRQTVSTPKEEIDYITRTFGAEEMKVRHIREIGLREGEGFKDAQPMNEKLFTFTITPRIITKSDVTFDFTASYDEKVLLDVKSVTTNSYDTVLLRGSQGGFGIREFIGPNGPERVPETRAMLVTITPVIQTARSLQNKPSELSRPTDQFGSKVVLTESDTYFMPVLINRAPLKFAPGALPKGSVTIEGIITPEGRVTNVKVLDSPDPAFNPKVIEVFRQYRFNPARLNGRPTYATWRETINLSKPAVP
jgi:TonB family protein